MSRLWRWLGIPVFLFAVGCQSPRYLQKNTSLIEPQRLRAVAEQWVGTPYRYGGNSSHGIDCSALAQKILQAFGILVPRTVRQQLRSGIPVSITAMQPGDLLFFAFRRKPEHVGVYLGNLEFVHASSTLGVVISSLRNPYYRRHLVAVRRFAPAVVKQR